MGEMNAHQCMWVSDTRSRGLSSVELMGRCKKGAWVCCCMLLLVPKCTQD